MRSLTFNMLWFSDLNDSATSNVLLAAPLFYVKRIPETEIQILGTVSSVRQERSSSVTNAPVLAKSVIETKGNHDKNVEETKRDVSLEELLTDESRKREKRIDKDKKSVEGETQIQKPARANKNSVNSSPTSTLGKLAGNNQICLLHR